MLSRFTYWADTHRTAKDDMRLGVCLAFVAGAANAGGFLAVGQYTSHLSGIVSGIADHLALSHLALALTGATSVLAFTAGAMCTAILVNFARRKRLHARFSIPLLIEAGLLLAFGLLGRPAAQQLPFLVPLTVTLLCLLMGLQNALITKISGSTIRTTHVTGLVTDIGIELGKLFYVNLPNDRHGARVLANRAKLRLYSSLLASFFIGAVVGAFGFKALGYAMTVPLAVLVSALAAPPLLHDIRIRNRLAQRQRRRLA